MAGRWADTIAVLPFLLVLVRIGGGELFAAQEAPAWYLLGGHSAGTVPAVVMHDILAPDLFSELWKLAVDLPDKSKLHLGEYWLPLGARPINTWEQAVLQIAAADLNYVLPSSVAARVAGVSWRVRVIASTDKRRSRNFHFDSDEQTDYIVPGVPLVHPLLSTVTYLNFDGPPTVLLDYTMRDSPNRTVLPRGGFIVMPARNKHLAFDPRLFHGVVGSLDYQHSLEPGTSKRIVIGMNFWEEPSRESWPNWQARKKQKPPARLPAAHVDHTKPHPNLRLLPLAASVLPVLNKSTCTLEQPAGLDEPSVPVMMSLGGLDFKHTARNRVALRFPRGKLFELERVERGSTVRFEFCEDDMQIEYESSPAKYPLEVAMETKRRNILTAERMLESRCGIFGATASEMNPPTALTFCQERGLVLRHDDEGGIVDSEL